MKWTFTEPSLGDMIRVKLGAIYHYGVYVSDSEVIEFGPPPERATSPDTIRIISAPIEEFLVGGFLEVAEFDKKEKKKNRKPDEIVRYARERLGQGGYDILKNNCEHFAYECVTGVRRSTQTDGVARQTADVHLYIAPLPKREPKGRVYPSSREEYINSATSDIVRRERFYVWRLLERALKLSFGMKLKRLEIKKLDSGAWSVGDINISLSHGGGALAVALSRVPVGVDVERVGERSVGHLSHRVLTEEELALFNDTDEESREELMLTLWVKKEAIFKCSGKESFSPAKISASGVGLTSDRVTLGDDGYVWAVATDSKSNVNLHVLDSKDII